ncbi:MAG: hypothetical protein HYW95_03205 [Candidatus Wildermuthbacteria bacterium]|nr:hypothetical protein [Candidatus Wildermuthbacteria bacterium]
MEKIDFCFFVTELARDGEFAVMLSREFEKRGLRTFFVTTSEAGDLAFQKAGLTNFCNIESMSKTMQITDENLGRAVERAQSQFGIESMSFEILTEKMVFKRKDDKEMMRKLLLYLFSLSEFFSKRFEVRYFVQGCSKSLNSIAFYYAGANQGKHIFFSASPIAGYLYFSFHPWGLLEVDPKNVKHVEGEARKRIEDYVAKVKEEKKVAIVLPMSKVTPSLTKERFQKLFYLLKNFRSEHLPILFILKNFTMRFFRQFYVRRFYQNPVPGEKYMYFPLHFPDDSQLTARAVPFITQEFVIEILSRYLPYGYKIYVKEHPASLGYYSSHMLRFICGLPNVKLVPPLLNSHGLIQKAEIVCVINSSVGYEALLYQKPVVTFGESFYSGRGVTLDIRNLYDVPKILQQAQRFQPDRERILSLLHAWYQESYPPSPERVFYDSHQEDAEVFCDALVKYTEGQIP